MNPFILELTFSGECFEYLYMANTTDCVFVRPKNAKIGTLARQTLVPTNLNLVCTHNLTLEITLPQPNRSHLLVLVCKAINAKNVASVKYLEPKPKLNMHTQDDSEINIDLVPLGHTSFSGLIRLKIVCMHVHVSISCLTTMSNEWT